MCCFRPQRHLFLSKLCPARWWILLRHLPQHGAGYGFTAGPGFYAYGYNDRGYGGETFLGLGFWSGYTDDSKIVAPSDMIAIGDAVLVGIGGFSKVSFIAWGNLGDNAVGVVSPVLSLASFNPADPRQLGVSAMRKRHGGSWNVVFCDGHVESLTANALWYPKPTVTMRWDIDHKPSFSSLP